MRTINNKDWWNLQKKIQGWIEGSKELEKASENPDFFRGQQIVLGNLYDFMDKIVYGELIWDDEAPITIGDED